jgi:Cu-processing system permease protein
MPNVVNVAFDLLREAVQRKWLLALLLGISLSGALLAWTLQMEVVDGVLAGTRLFGNLLRHDVRATDLALRPVFSGTSWFMYVAGLLFGVLACSDFAPELLAAGRIEHLLALPLRRAELIAGTYLGVMLLSVACALYAGAVFTVLLGLKSGVWTACIVMGGLAGCLAFSAVYAAMLLSAVFVRSAALSAAIGVLLLIAGSGFARPEFAAVLSPGLPRNFFTGLVAFVPRFWLLGRLGPVAAGFEALDAELVRTSAGTIIFASACVMLAIWQCERRDY